MTAGVLCGLARRCWPRGRLAVCPLPATGPSRTPPSRVQARPTALVWRALSRGLSWPQWVLCHKALCPGGQEASSPSKFLGTWKQVFVE